MPSLESGELTGEEEGAAAGAGVFALSVPFATGTTGCTEPGDAVGEDDVKDAGVWTGTRVLEEAAPPPKSATPGGAYVVAVAVGV